jgi:hypothetical protein
MGWADAYVGRRQQKVLGIGLRHSAGPLMVGINMLFGCSALAAMALHARRLNNLLDRRHQNIAPRCVQGVGLIRMVFAGRALTVCKVCALSDLDNISVRIADIAARLPVLGDRLCDELRSSTFP